MHNIGAYYHFIIEEGGAHQALTLLGDKQAVNSYWTEGLTGPHPSPENV